MWQRCRRFKIMLLINIFPLIKYVYIKLVSLKVILKYFLFFQLLVLKRGEEEIYKMLDIIINF